MQIYIILLNFTYPITKIHKNIPKIPTTHNLPQFPIKNKQINNYYQIMLPPLSIFSLTISILFLSLAPPPTACLHLYAGVQQTYLVSQSPSLKNIYKCKDRCFELNETFPFPMKYVRTVWARSGTNHMYLEGHCYLNLSLSETNPWTLFSSLNQTNIVSSPEQLATWQTYTQDCENKLVQMNPQLRITLGLTKVHSEYIFYSDGKFENTQEDKQGDIGEILRGLLGGL